MDRFLWRPDWPEIGEENLVSPLNPRLASKPSKSDPSANPQDLITSIGKFPKAPIVVVAYSVCMVMMIVPPKQHQKRNSKRTVLIVEDGDLNRCGPLKLHRLRNIFKASDFQFTASST